MGQILDLRYNLRNYFSFKTVEYRGLILTTLILAFVISFKQWGVGPNVDLVVGMTNFLNAILVVALALLVRETARKIVGLAGGVVVEFRLWFFGLLIALVLTFLAQPLPFPIWFIIGGGFLVNHVPGLRLGFFRYETNYWVVGLVALAGAWANIWLAVFFKIISLAIGTTTPIMGLAMKFNIFFALFNMLPLPPFDGLKAWYGSRLVYAFSFCSMIGISILLYLIDSIVWTLVGGFIVGIIGWLIYYVKRERKSWGGVTPGA